MWTKATVVDASMRNQHALVAFRASGKPSPGAAARLCTRSLTSFASEAGRPGMKYLQTLCLSILLLVRTARARSCDRQWWQPDAKFSRRHRYKEQWHLLYPFEVGSGPVKKRAFVSFSRLAWLAGSTPPKEAGIPVGSVGFLRRNHSERSRAIAHAFRGVGHPFQAGPALCTPALSDSDLETAGTGAACLSDLPECHSCNAALGQRDAMPCRRS